MNYCAEFQSADGKPVFHLRSDNSLLATVKVHFCVCLTGASCMHIADLQMDTRMTPLPISPRATPLMKG